MENVLMIIVIMSGMICGLVAVIYKILAERINNITKTHNDLAVNIASIQTNICWIKKRLEKL